MNVFDKALALKNRFQNNHDGLWRRFYGAAIDDYAGLASFGSNASDEEKADMDAAFLHDDLEFVLTELFERLDENNPQLSTFTSKFINRHYNYVSY